jgi:uncharacterized protein (DUF736 family)
VRRASPPAWSTPSRPHRAVEIQTQETIMAIIGTFTRTEDGKYIGSLKTLTLSSKLQFVPETNKSKDSAPDFRIFQGSFEVGAGWQRTGKDSGRDYCSVRLDDPAFAAPLYASLIEAEDGKTFNLLWSRRTGD